MRYCGIAVGPEFQHLCALEEVRGPEPPVRLRATFFEPGTVDEVVGELRALEEVVVAVGAPQCPPAGDERLRACDAELLRRGVAAHPYLDAGAALYEQLADLGIYAPAADGDGGGPGAEPFAVGGRLPVPATDVEDQGLAAPDAGEAAPRAREEGQAAPAARAEPEAARAEPEPAVPPDAGPAPEATGGVLGDDTIAAGPGELPAREASAVGAGAAGAVPLLEGPVEEGAFRTAAVFEVNVDGVFCALQGRRVPAKRHPLGILRRIEELLEDQVDDEGGELWHRRIEELEAAAAALTAHRYAVAHACWIGDPREAVIVLPGTRPPAVFSAEGVIPAVPRAPLGGG